MKSVYSRSTMFRGLFTLLAAIALTAAPLHAATKSKSFTNKISSLGGNNFYRQWFTNNPSGADSVYRYTLTFGGGRIKHVPLLNGSGTSRIIRIWNGESMRITTDETFSDNSTRNVTSVAIQFSSDKYAKAGSLSASSGTFSYNESAKTATWTGKARSVVIYFDVPGKTAANNNANWDYVVSQVTTTISYETDGDCVCQPAFTPCNQYDFRTATQDVTLSCATAGATIYYTTDGSEPTTASAAYAGPVTIDKTTLFRAIAVKDGKASGEDTCKIFKNECNFKVGDDDFFKSKTYTWADVNNTRGQGAGATITSDMTEEATTPEQIYALLKAVYTDPTIPGQIYQNPGEEITYNRYKYWTTDGLSRGYSQWTASVMDGLKYWYSGRLATDPVEGYTVMLVKVRDDYNSTDYKAGKYKHGDLNGGTAYSSGNDNNVFRALSECYESVKVLYGTHYQDENMGYMDAGYNPGAFYQFDAIASRFFFISKGSALWNSGYPLVGLYEEVAPAEEDAQNVYPTLMDNTSFLSSHDCPSVVPDKGHMLSMDATGAAYELKNMVLFMPDYRLKFWEQNAQSTRWPVRWVTYYNRNRDLCGTHGVQAYHPGYEPRLMLYTIRLGASAVPDKTQEHEYTSTPAWTSTVGDISPSAPIPQEYLLYEVQRDAEGNETLVPLNGGEPLQDITTYSYNVPQYSYTRTITYLVKGRLQGSTAEWVLSNYADVVIPGYDDPRLGLVEIGTRYTSTYVPATQKNLYRNYPRVVNDPASPLTDAQLAVGTKLYIHRYEAADAEPNTGNVVATIEVTGKAAAAGGGCTFTATVTPGNMQGDADPSLYPGTFTFSSRGGDGYVDFGNLYIADQFSAYTAENNHPDAYYYQLTMTEAANDVYLESRTVKAPVYKTDYAVRLAPYTQSEALTDTDHSLSLAQCSDFTLQVHHDSNITTYDIWRDPAGTTPSTVARAQHLAVGEYTTSGTGTNGKMEILERDLTFEDGHTVRAVGVTDYTDYTGDGHNYVAVINVNTNDANDKLFLSTYGTAQRNISAGTLDVSVNSLEKTRAFGSMMFYACDVTIDASGLMTGYTPWRYHLWRVNRDGSEVLLNTLTTGTSWGTTYDNLNAQNPGTSVTVHDIFYDKSLDEIDGNAFTVTYVARLYSTEPDDGKTQHTPDDPESDAPRRAEFDAVPQVNIIESSNIAYYHMNVITGVADLTAQPEPVSVTYYNPLGFASTKPHPGLNIVVTRNADGTIDTYKTIRK